MTDKLTARYAYANLLLRIPVGLIFIAHGAQKLFGVLGGPAIHGTAQFLEQIGIFPGVFWAVVVGFVEFFGGIAVILGIFNGSPLLSLPSTCSWPS